MSLLARTAIVFLVMLAGAQTTADAQSAPRGARDRNALSAEEIEASTSGSVYELVRQKRPRWLTPRGSSTLRLEVGKDMFGKPMEYPAEANIVVYLDNVRNGTQEVLRSISPHAVESLEFLDAIAATQRFGTNHEYGAILVKSKAG